MSNQDKYTVVEYRKNKLQKYMVAGKIYQLFTEPF